MAPIQDDRDALALCVSDWATGHPDSPAYTELRFRLHERTARTLSYFRLHHAAGALARNLRQISAPGDRVAILCDHGLDYTIAFLACLYSNRVAVPLFPVAGTRNHERLHTVLADARPTVGLLSAADANTAGTLGCALGQVLRLPADPTEPAHETDDPVIDPIRDDLAYLQYTSGSTTAPRGVRVTHDNLRTALEQLHAALPIAADRPILTWLPFFHDMGLIYGLCLPLFRGTHGITMAPAEFVKRPLRWLRALTDYRAGFTGGPNFGLSLAVSGTTAEDRADLDLSGLTVLLNGSEPIRADVLTEFSATFSECGFRHQAHTPGYGLAEATLSVTVCDQETPPITRRFVRDQLTAGHVLPSSDSDGVELVGCGTPADQAVRIVDPDTNKVVPGGRVGEIWVCGDNVCDGYFGRPDATLDTFDATLAIAAPADAGDIWLRTGDLGFWHEDQLFIAGRRKDIIVIDGRNHYPADIEATVAECATQVRRGHVTAFGHDDGRREDLVVVAELSSTESGDTCAYFALARQIRATVAATHEVRPGAVLLVAAGQIPKTTSGKLRRGECRARYLAGQLDPIALI